MTDTQNPDYQSDSFSAALPLWRKVDAVYGGTEAMRVSGEYLPQFPMESDDVHEKRLATSTLWPAYRETIEGIVGTVFRKPFKLGEKVSPPIASDLENVDNAGTHFEVFGQRLMRTGVHHGASYVLVDMPKQPDVEVLDASQAQEIGFRPFWVLYSASELANWPRYVIINGAPVMQLIVFREQSVEPSDFGESCADRYRVWRLPVVRDAQGNYHRAGKAEWEIWEKQTDEKMKTDTFLLIDFGVSPLEDIPVAVFNANPCLTNPQECDGPVLMDAANLNVKHYQISSDHEWALHTCSPTAFTVNLKEDGAGNNGEVGKVPYGNGVRWDLDDGGSAGYVEPQGTGLERREAWIERIEKQLRDIGAALAMEDSEKGGANTEIEAALRGGSRTSRLTQLTRAWQDCFETALAFTAQWKGESEGGEITLGVKDTDLVISPTDTAAFSTQQEKGQLSLKTFWKLLQRGGILPDDFDAEDELKEIIDEKKKMTAAMPVPTVSNFTQPNQTNGQSKPVPAKV